MTNVDYNKLIYNYKIIPLLIFVIYYNFIHFRNYNFDNGQRRPHQTGQLCPAVLLIDGDRLVNYNLLL